MISVYDIAENIHIMWFQANFAVGTNYCIKLRQMCDLVFSFIYIPDMLSMVNIF